VAVTDEPKEEREAEDKAAAEQENGQSALPAEEIVPGEEVAEAPSEVEVLQKELALLEEQLADMRNRYLRAVADLDNARKRARQEVSEARSLATASVLTDLLAVVDNFERALETTQVGSEAPQDAKAIYEGITMIYRQLMSILERRGVRPIEALGKRFDPKYHEAVAQVPATGHQKEGTVALEMQKGYLMGDRVLRPSRVGVAVRDAGEGGGDRA